MKITITAEDIATGARGCRRSCPIALAGTRAGLQHFRVGRQHLYADQFVNNAGGSNATGIGSYSGQTVSASAIAGTVMLVTELGVKNVMAIDATGNLAIPGAFCSTSGMITTSGRSLMTKEWPSPEIAQRFVDNFDRGEPVFPFSFWLDVGDGAEPFEAPAIQERELELV